MGWCLRFCSCEGCWSSGVVHVQAPQQPVLCSGLVLLCCLLLSSITLPPKCCRLGAKLCQHSLQRVLRGREAQRDNRRLLRGLVGSARGPGLPRREPTGFASQAGSTRSQPTRTFRPKAQQTLYATHPPTHTCDRPLPPLPHSPPGFYSRSNSSACTACPLDQFSPIYGLGERRYQAGLTQGSAQPAPCRHLPHLPAC